MVLKYGSSERCSGFLAGWKRELRKGTMVEVSPGLFKFVKEHPENVLLSGGQMAEIEPGLFLWDPSGRYF